MGNSIGKHAADKIVKFAEHNPVLAEVALNQQTLDNVADIAHTLAHPQIGVDPTTLMAATQLGDRVVSTADILGGTVGTVTSCVTALAPWNFARKVATTAITTGGAAYTSKKYAESGVAVAKHLSEGIATTGRSLEIATKNLDSAALHAGEDFVTGVKLLDCSASRLENGLQNVKVDVHHQHYFAIEEKTAKALVTSAKIVGGTVALVGGTKMAISEYRSWQDRKNFTQDNILLRKLRTPGYVSTLSAGEKATFQSQVDASIGRLERHNAKVAKLYHQHYNNQFYCKE